MNEPIKDPLYVKPAELPGEPASQHQPSMPKGGFSKKRIALVLVGLIVLLGIGFGFALLTSGTETSPTSNTTTTESSETDNPASEVTDVPVVTATKTFKADFPRVEFTYPENWKVAANRDEEGIRVESPEFNYQSVNGNTIKGHFRIYIRQGARQVDSKYIGRGIAALPSEKIAYVNPPAGQRPETNISFFGLDSSDHFAFFLIAGNFSLQKDESLGPEYGTEPETYIISGGYTSNELTDDMATNPVPLEYFGQTNVYKQAIEIVRSLKLL